MSSGERRYVAPEARRSGVCVLDKDEESAIRDGLAQLDRGETLTEAEMRSFWKRCGVAAAGE
jgi:predicted transcriptional regulator